jgi:TRAP-type C4-dicarboxylate transport system permease small subunit
MKGWAVLMTAVVIVAGICVMLLWSAVNALLAAQTAAVDWPRTAVALLVFLLCVGFFVRFVNRFAESADA